MMRKIFVLAAAALFVLGMSTPSWAVADFAIGASARIDAGWQFSDLGDSNGIGGEDSQTQFFLVNPGNSRLNFKATVGDVTGFVEFAMGSTTVSTRHIYASWDMGGGGSLLFGHTWSIMSFGFTDLRLNGDDANIGFGCLYFGRNPQIRYTYAGEAFTVKVSIEDPDEAFFGPASSATHLAESFIPMFSASVSFNPLENLSLTPSAFYTMYELTGIAPGVSDVDIDAFGFALDGRVDFDIARISFEGWIGENVGVSSAGFDSRPAAATTTMGVPVTDAVGTDVEDVTAWGGFVQLTFRFEPAILNLGAGYQESDVENPGVNFEDDVATAAYFINVLYNLTDNFYIQPEIAYFDYGDDANKNAFGVGNSDLGSDIFAGVHFQADF
jgi:hypothetical protein